MEKTFPYHDRLATVLGLPKLLPGTHSFDFYGGQSAQIEIQYTWLAVINRPDAAPQIVAVSKSNTHVAVHLLVKNPVSDGENSCVTEIPKDPVYSLLAENGCKAPEEKASQLDGAMYEVFYHSHILDAHFSFTEGATGFCEELRKAINSMASDIAYRSGKPHLIGAAKELK